MDAFKGQLKVGEEAVINLVSTLAQKVGAFLPHLVGALLVLFVGWIMALFLRHLARKIFQILGFHHLAERSGVNDLLRKFGIEKRTEDLLASLVYLTVLLIFIVSATEVLGIHIVIETLNRFIAYIPQIFGAIFVFVFLTYIGKFLRQVLVGFLENYGLAYAKVLGGVVEIIIGIFALIMALRELGFDTSVFTANVTLVLGLFLLACALALGLGGQRIAAKILSGFYVRQQLRVGEEINLDQIKGKIKAFRITGLILESEKEELLIPYDLLVEKVVAKGKSA